MKQAKGILGKDVSGEYVVGALKAFFLAPSPPSQSVPYEQELPSPKRPLGLAPVLLAPCPWSLG